MHHHRIARDDRHSYAQLTRFLSPAALAHCDLAEAAPALPRLRPALPLVTSIDAELESLWSAS
jgi:hypothetical protein